ncbi:MAG TPA: cytochrome c maturation protein CcmE [Thermoanaerobaculia bacterium]|nr:cytochrome c maturation protein CcmE [Thermoanaerobaculia bacterium]
MSAVTTAPSASDAMRRRSRLFMLGAFVVAAVAFAVIAASGINQNLVYYWTPTDLRAAGDKAYGATIRLGGMVTPGTIRNLGGSSGIEFDVHDGAAKVHVKTAGVPPQMFRDNIGVVVEGTMVPGGYFKSNRLMVSHDNEYRAPEQGHPMNQEELKKLMKSTEGLD